jgi:hypothetical protein
MQTSTIKNSIWLMLPVSIIIVWVISGFNGISDWDLIWSVPLMILTYGAFIWVPSVVMTYTLESILLRPTSKMSTVVLVFGLETILTFAIITMIFGDFSMNIPFLALVMSSIIQAARLWWIHYQTKKQTMDTLDSSLMN